MGVPAAPLPRESQGEERFRWRGGGVSRIEGLTDGVFALALTLLIVSLEVPRTFDALLAAFRQVPVFALTFAMFAWVWSIHHRFHRRFGLEDAVTVFWNLVLLFLILLYVYPLKFLAGALCQMWGLVPTGDLPEGYATAGLREDEFRPLMLLYGAGFASIFAVLAMLHHRAWALRDSLGLDEAERLITRAEVRKLGLTAGLGCLSLALASVSDGPGLFLSGAVYWFTGVVHGMVDSRTRRALKALP